MKICEIWIHNFQQFKNVHIDLTNPETGEPVSMVCFIGGNGTGKTTLLRFLNNFIKKNNYNNFGNKVFFPSALRIISDDGVNMICVNIRNRMFYMKESIKKDLGWFAKFIKLKEEKEYEDLENIYKEYLIDDIKSSREFFSKNPFYLSAINNRIINDRNWVLINSPSETDSNSYVFSGLPKTNLNEALKLNQVFPLAHEVSNRTITDFWKTLIYHIKKREEERNEFENLSENLDKSKRELIEEFDKAKPNIESKLAALWNKILGNAGLELDLENIKKPTQLTDNLQAFIRLKSTGERIEYHQLSTGVRNFIFRIGHIFSLYFNREIKSGFLLVDEPENSLFPDFLFDLMETYDEIVKDKNGENNTQMFFATHNPIVAAQFEPYERIILDWDEEGSVTASKRISPIGDDPNDLLSQDFGLSNLMGKKGQEVWKEYLSLKKKLRMMMLKQNLLFNT